MLGPYVLHQVLGTGSFGVVWLGEDMYQRVKVALKISPKDGTKRSAEYARNEALVMEQVAHPHNVAVLNFFETEHYCVLAMPYVTGGDMLMWLREQRRLPEATAKQLFYKICKGVEHSHNMGYVHRDIKLENILLNVEGDHPVLADWGFGGPWHASVLQNKSLGSLHYSAPEICRGSYYIGPEVDVWSLGVVLYALVTGKLPFRSTSHHTTQEEILIANPRYPAELSPEIVGIIRRMLEPDRALRISIPDLLMHPWMVGGSFTRCSSAPSIVGRENSEIIHRVSTAPVPSTGPGSMKRSKSKQTSPATSTTDVTKKEDKKERDHSRPNSPLPLADTERFVTASPPPSPTSFFQKYLPFRRLSSRRPSTS